MPLLDSMCISLIGIAGAGKSTLAPLLARELGWEWLDTDRLIEATYGGKLQAIMDACGTEKFLELEGRTVAHLGAQRCVISTGGSVIYCDEAVRRLRLLGPVVFLDISLESFRKRVGEAQGRAFVCREGQGRDDVFTERRPLYLSCADVVVRTDEATPGECVRRIVDRLTNDEVGDPRHHHDHGHDHHGIGDHRGSAAGHEGGKR
ncbi:Shikimate kinase [Desulfovibrio sp. X2]|uniref:homoserine kinase n=1 Tax=Desulfovibrio sp. X2 TaxID=941449 RepID=UPI0003589ACF|nr:homoserine kinase [Desulfovibrio sp. X2]EPR40860.1 Shikimate kinase [Desulfovibrio sp. X2]